MKKPMLAAEGVLGQIKYPKYASLKLNGVRGFVLDGQLMARSLKPIPNRYTRELFSHTGLDGLDGELVVGPFGAEDVFSATTSGVMSQDGKPDVRLHVFDRFDLAELPFKERIGSLSSKLRGCAVLYPGLVGKLVQVEQALVKSDKEVKEMEVYALSLGYEGLVLRDLDAQYKFGRSTEKEGGFMRYCTWVTGEAEITGIEEGSTNTNPKQKNELGYTKRSFAKAGMVGTGVAGALVVRELKTNVVFNIPLGKLKNEAGSTLETKEWFWANKDKVIGRIVRYRARPTVKTAPRYPSFEGFRDPRDMS